VSFVYVQYYVNYDSVAFLGSSDAKY